MPKVTSGSLLRLRADGADLPITVKVPPKKVYGGCLHITKIEMGGCEGSGGSLVSEGQ